jgi:quercetin dioxygenase-like cupin family protein
VKRWDLRSLAPSSKKRTAREPGADAPRVPMVGRQMPRVLFSSPECRAVVIDLQSGEELGDHHVRERAVVEVIAGRVSIECSEETVECEAGTLVTFDPGEHHTVRALADARLLLLLAPWPAEQHNTEPEKGHGQRLPANAVAEPIPSLDATADRPA